MRTAICHWTGVETTDFTLAGFLPGVPAVFPMANTEEARAAYKKDLAIFRASEGNCNTCKHLVRRWHKKDLSGFLRGACAKNSEIGYPLTIEFHPDDPMHMQCYEGRE